MNKAKFVRMEARLKKKLYREVALKSLKALIHDSGPYFIFDCGCGEAYEAVYGFFPVLRRLKLNAEITILLLDLSKKALEKALRKLKQTSSKGIVEVYAVVCDVAHLPFNKVVVDRALGFYGSILHELYMRKSLNEALSEARRYYRLMAGYDYVDPDPRGEFKIKITDLNADLRKRIFRLAEKLGEQVDDLCRLSLVLEAVYQLSFPGGQPLSHLHFTRKASSMRRLLSRQGLRLRWTKRYDIAPEVGFRLKALGAARLSFPFPLKGRLAWLAERYKHSKDF